MTEGRLPDNGEPCGVFFDDAPDGIFVGYFEAESGIPRCTQVNPALCRMLGYAREELVGTRIIDLVPPEEAALFARDHEVLRVRDSTLETRELRMRRKDGAWLPVEATASLRSDGRWHAFVRDVSARKRAESERDESLRWVRAVLEQSPVGLVLVHGPRAERLELNARAQQLLGAPTTIDEIRGWLHAPDGHPLAPAESPSARALRGERTVGAEILVRNSAGAVTPIAVSAAPITGPDGTAQGAVVAFEDITALKELERLRAEWSSVVAHDLRQPLAAISVSAVMTERATNDPKVLKNVERIIAAAKRMNRMVGDLMDLSRLEAHRLELLRQPVDVPALVRASVERYSLEAADRSFDVRVQGDVRHACADPDRVTQVMENLLTNAIKYGTAGSPIVVTIAHDGGDVVIAVTNEGRALMAEEIEHLFERFQRTDSAKRARIQGVGLGLYITRSLVEAHGGRMSAESTPQGTNTFRFTLPVAGTTCGQ
jgi:PAS domain S-box-containing protein